MCEQKLTPMDPQESAVFGYSISVSGDVAIIGSYDAQGIGPSSGTAYVFRFDSASNQWQQEQKLVPVDLSSNDEFGYSVAIDGDTIAVAAPGADATHADSGAVYVFRYGAGNWVQEQKLDAGQSNVDRIGWRVDIDDDVIVAGTYYEQERAVIFRRTGKNWAEEKHLTVQRKLGPSG